MDTRENFVRRNLKKRPFRYKSNRAVKSNVKSSRYDSRSNSNNNDGLCDSSSETNETSAELNKPPNKPSGLVSLGIDPLELSLEWINSTDQQNSTSSFGTIKENTKEVQPPSHSGSKVIRGLSVPTHSQSGLSKLQEYEKIEILNSIAPKCPGHQMLARLCTVNKPGSNKVRTAAPMLD